MSGQWQEFCLHDSLVAEGDGPAHMMLGISDKEILVAHKLVD